MEPETTPEVKTEAAALPPEVAPVAPVEPAPVAEQPKAEAEIAPVESFPVPVGIVLAKFPKAKDTDRYHAAAVREHLGHFRWKIEIAETIEGGETMITLSAERA